MHRYIYIYIYIYNIFERFIPLFIHGRCKVERERYIVIRKRREREKERRKRSGRKGYFARWKELIPRGTRTG